MPYREAMARVRLTGSEEGSGERDRQGFPQTKVGLDDTTRIGPYGRDLLFSTGLWGPIQITRNQIPQIASDHRVHRCETCRMSATVATWLRSTSS